MLLGRWFRRLRGRILGVMTFAFVSEQIESTARRGDELELVIIGHSLLFRLQFVR